jgi:CPA2 family monovalent cation:H+ antiporter-2
LGIAADFVLIVVAGLAGGLLARALRVPLLVGYVAAGVLVGPYTAGPTVVQVHDIEQLATSVPAALSLGPKCPFEICSRSAGLPDGPLQIILIPPPPRGRRKGDRCRDRSVWFGAMISLSSTVVVLKTLSAAGVTSTFPAG